MHSDYYIPEIIQLLSPRIVDFAVKNKWYVGLTEVIVDDKSEDFDFIGFRFVHHTQPLSLELLWNRRGEIEISGNRAPEFEDTPIETPLLELIQFLSGLLPQDQTIESIGGSYSFKLGQTWKCGMCGQDTIYGPDSNWEVPRYIGGIAICKKCYRSKT